MIRKPYFLRAALACAAIVFMACGGNVVVEKHDGGGVAGGGGGSGGTTIIGYDTCAVATDCGWGEIDHEIVTSSDCICLFGCPFIPLNVDTVNRRTQQYNSLCTPGIDGQGNPCAVDDCAGPGPAACNAGHCGAPAVP
jgi:hypothetical protein